MNVLESYNTNLPAVIGMTSCDKHTIWVHNCQEDILQQMSLEDGIKVTTRYEGIRVYDMTRYSDENFLLSMISDFNIVMFSSKSGMFKPYKDLSPLLTLGIHYTKDSELIVGFQENASTFPITECSRRGIIVYDRNGQTKLHLETDKKERRLFTCPYRITTNTNKDICVCDIFTNDNSGRVVVLDAEGVIKWSYIGHSTINQGWSKFNPEGIASTTCGNIVITDCNNHAIHVLTNTGDILLCYVSFLAPCSINIDANNCMLVGCSAKKDERNAKILLLKFAL